MARRARTGRAGDLWALDLAEARDPHPEGACPVRPGAGRAARPRSRPMPGRRPARRPRAGRRIAGGSWRLETLDSGAFRPIGEAAPLRTRRARAAPRLAPTGTRPEALVAATVAPSTSARPAGAAALATRGTTPESGRIGRARATAGRIGRSPASPTLPIALGSRPTWPAETEAAGSRTSEPASRTRWSWAACATPRRATARRPPAGG
jgi:hypothetical protein